MKELNELLEKLQLEIDNVELTEQTMMHLDNANKIMIKVWEQVEKLTIPVVNSSADFRENANPLLKYLAENHHPHTTAIITSTSIELVEGIKTEHKIYDYIQD